MAKKKEFTTADGAIDKLFTVTQNKEKSKQTQKDNVVQNAQESHVMDITHNVQELLVRNVANDTKESHIVKVKNDAHNTQDKKRGKRAERIGLLLDEQLKEDLKHLSKAMNSKSANDFIVSILVEYVERAESQLKLKQYRKLLRT